MFVPRSPVLLAFVVLGLLPAGPGSSQTPGAIGEADQASVLSRLEDAAALSGSGSPDENLAALILLEEAAALARHAGRADLEAAALQAKGRTLRATGDVAGSSAAFELGLGAARRTGERSLVLALLDDLVGLERETESWDAALLHLRERALLQQELGQFQEEGMTHLQAAETATLAGRGADAERALATAVSVFRHTGDERMVLVGLEQQAELELRRGRTERAVEIMKDVVERARTSAGSELAQALCLLGHAHRAEGRLDLAIKAYLESTEVCQESSCAADSAEGLAFSYLGVRQAQVGIPHALKAIQLRRQMQDGPGEARGHLCLGMSFAALGRLEPARSCMDQALALLTEEDYSQARATVLAERAKVQAGLKEKLASLDDQDEALALLDSERGSSAESLGFPTAMRPEPLRRERLAYLVSEGLWGRALESCSSCAGGQAPDLDELRELARTERATVLVHQLMSESVLSWAILPTGRLVGTQVTGVTRADVTFLIDGVERLVAAGTPTDERRAGLRRLHDLLIGPMVDVLAGAGTDRLLFMESEPLSRVPLGLLLSPDGESLGLTHVVAEIPGAGGQLPKPVGGARVFADLSEYGPSAELLAIREALGAPSASERPDRYLSGTLVEANLEALPEPPSLLFLLGVDRPPPALNCRGSAVVLGASPGQSSLDLQEARAELFRAGARSVISLRRSLPAPSESALLVALARGLEPGLPLGDALRKTLGELAASATTAEAWGALRLEGSPR